MITLINLQDILSVILFLALLSYAISFYYRHKLNKKHCQQLVEFPEFREEMIKLVEESRKSDYKTIALEVGKQCQLDLAYGQEIVNKLKI